MRVNPKFRIAFAQNGPFAVLLLMIVVFTMLNSRFFSLANAKVIGVSMAEVGILAVVFSLLVMAGGVDLSVGSVASVSGVVCCKVMVSSGSPLQGILAALGVGLLAGLVNGLLIAYLGLNPIVATLGALSAWGGAALYISEGETISGLPDSFIDFAAYSPGTIPVQLILLGVAVTAAWLVRYRTRLGKQILAVGGNERAAHLMGVSVKLTRLGLYVATGIAASLAGILISARLNAAPPTLGLSMEVTVLIVVLLGGVAFEGGYGRIGGVVAGLLVIGALRNGLILVGVSQFVQTILIGCTLVVAVGLDRAFQRVITSSWQSLGAEIDADSSQTPTTPQPATV